MTEYELIRKEELKQYMGYTGVVIFARVMRSSPGKITSVSQKQTVLEVSPSGSLYKIPASQILMAEVEK